MTLKANVGVSKKIGEPSFGSRGASAHFEIELDSRLIDEPDRLRERVRQIFRLAQAAVDEELVGSREATANGQPEKKESSPRNGHAPPSPRLATASQLRRLRTLAERQGIDLAQLLRERLHVEPPGVISITEASALITELQKNANGAEVPGVKLE